MEDILIAEGLEELIPVFAENEINLDNINDLTADLVKELIPKIGTRIRFSKFIENRRRYSASDVLPFVFTDEDYEKVMNVNSPSASSTTSSANDEYNIIVPTTNTTISFCGMQDLLLEKENPIKNFPDFDLKTLLITAPHGSKILNFYQLNNRLNDPLRNKLVDIIMGHLYTYILQYRLTHSQYNILCSKIISLFPSEISQAYYKFGKKINNAAMQAKGKLVHKSHNIIACSPDRIFVRKRRSSGDRHDNKKAKEITEEEKNHIIWLKHNREPWEEVLKRWRATTDLRIGENVNTVSEFISNWPIVADPRASTLIEADFQYLYPGKELLLLSKWDLFFQSILKQKDQGSELNKRDILLQDLLVLLGDSSRDLSEDSKVAIQISLLPRLIPPKGRAKVGKEHWKFSTNESVEGLIVHATIPGDIEQKIDNQRKKADKRKIYRHVQPYLIVEGPHISNIRNTYVVIDKIHFHVESVLKGLDILFKCFLALHIKYPVQSEYIWLLIQKVIFDIPLATDANVSNIIDLFNILN